MNLNHTSDPGQPDLRQRTCSSPFGTFRRQVTRLSIAAAISLVVGVCGVARAGDTTITLQGYTSGAFRWKDVASNLYSASCG